MSFWTVLSCCFGGSRDADKIKDTLRPRAQVRVNGVTLQGLFDTGSTVTLMNSKLKTQLLTAGSNPARPPPVRLCGADGKPLKTAGCYSLEFDFKGNARYHNVLFIDNLQVSCIIGMDLMAKFNITIDTKTRSIRMNQVPDKTDHILLTSKAMVFEPDHETLIKLKSPVPFSKGLLEANGGLPDGLHVMDGITEPDEDGMIGVVVANFSHLNVKMPSKTAIARLSTHPGLLITPLSECLIVAGEKPKIIDSSHVSAIDLQSVPPRYRSHYERLLVSFADVFSKNDLDIGHCRSLPHHV